MRAPHRLWTWTAMLVLFLIPLAAAACGTLDVSFERPAEPDESATSGDLTRSPERPGIPTATPAAPLPQLVYRTADGIWKAGHRGQPVQILDRAEYGGHSVPAISPDGAHALYLGADEDDLDLWLVDLTTREQRNLTRTPERVETNFCWWPARPDVVLLSARPREMAPGPGVTGFLAVVGTDGHDYRVLDDQNHTGGLPSPSPDGRAIAYGSGSTGWLHLWDTGPQVFDPADYGLPGYREAQIASPSWSPDGRKLAWIVSGGFAEGGSLRMGVAVFDLETRTAQLLHLHEAAFGDSWPPAPVWSPDGGWLAFTAWARDPDQAGVWVVRVDEGQGEGYQSLFTEYHLGGSEPVWSPDGRWLAFHRTLGDGGTGPWLAQVGTWGLIRLALPPDAYVVNWLSPTGTAAVLEQIDSTLQPDATPRPTSTPMPPSKPTPYCRPSDASVSLSASSTTVQVGQAVSVTETLVNGATDVRLGLIQYSLTVQPKGALTSDNLGPVEHRNTLEPGQSDAAEFVLRATTPGRATLTGSTSFEIHALDYSSGSWSGCESGPLEIVVRADPSKIIGVHDDLRGQEGYAYRATTIAVAEASVWVGFASSPGVGGGVWRYDGEKWETFTQVDGFPVSDDVQVLRAAPDGSVWAGAGCQVARFSDGLWFKMADCETLRGNVTDIVFTPDGATWVASTLELSRFDGHTWTSYGKLAHDLAVGPDGVLWVSGWEGLQTSSYVARFDGADWTTYHTVELLGHGVGSIAVTPDGVVWGDAGEHGIARYDGETWRHTDAMGLPDSQSRRLVVGPDGVLWAVGNEGLAYRNGDRWAVHEAGAGGGPLDFGPDGTLWLGTSDGVLHLRP